MKELPATAEMDAVADADRDWFEQHPDRSYHVRLACAGEIPGYEPSKDRVSQVVINQVYPGCRVRVYFNADRVVPDNEEDASLTFYHAMETGEKAAN